MEKYAKAKHAESTSAALTGQHHHGTMQFRDRRTSTAAQQALQRKIQSSGHAPGQETTQLKTLISQSPVIQRRSNGGLPAKLQSGIESLSGMDMSGVKVHYNSQKPAQLQAHAYAQGNSIHLGPGQEKHLPHEAWHVVQQKQGRVQPTMQMAKVNINDDKGLESEADRMGAKALQNSNHASPFQRKASPMGKATVQRAAKPPKKGKAPKKK